MKKSLLHTCILVCAVIIAGFITTSIISYRSNLGVFYKNIESVSKLTSEGIYHQIDSMFTKPVHISMTMANDSLLRNFLANESEHLHDEEFISVMKGYLGSYREIYNYDSVFLVSVKTSRYYYYNGIDRVLDKGDSENDWYFDFLKSNKDMSVVVDNDQVVGSDNKVTIFINCRITDDLGETIGVVGVGFQVDYLQNLIREYKTNFGLNILLVNSEGDVEISTDYTSFEEKKNLFDNSDFAGLKETVLSSSSEETSQWYGLKQDKGFVISRYIENFDWHLIVDNETAELNHEMRLQLLFQIVIVIVVIVIIIVVLTYAMRRYNKKIIELTRKNEKEHQSAFREATEQMYEHIYEIDITHNCSASIETSLYFESLGASGNIPYDEALRVIAEKQIKEEYRNGYIELFSSKNVLKEFAGGTENLSYDFMITEDGENYYWMRIRTHIFFWSEDKSVRMMVYRQSIDNEKRHELYMQEQMQLDSLTGLYNKVSAQERVHKLLENDGDALFAFFIIDIDYFKKVNDCFGHAAGDMALAEFAHVLKAQFGEDDIVGRIGGDEFIGFSRVKSQQMAVKKANELSAKLNKTISSDGADFSVTASIGVSLSSISERDFETLYKQADKALYEAKKKGRNCFVLAENSENNN